jgi:hypothetical protein
MLVFGAKQAHNCLAPRLTRKRPDVLK